MMQTLQAVVAAALQNIARRLQALTLATLLAVATLAVVAQPRLAACSPNQDQDQNNDQTQKPAAREKGIDPRSNPPPPEQPPASAPAAARKTPDDPGKVAYLAQKDIEVGTFYLHKGDLAAAIDRFHHAAETRPTLSKPWELLGEAYEKMDDKEEALASYQQYLKIQPGAADARKVQRKIAKLQSDRK